MLNKAKPANLPDDSSSDEGPAVKKAKTCSRGHETDGPKEEGFRLCLIVNSAENTQVYYQTNLNERAFQAISRLHGKNDFEDDETGELELDGVMYDARQVYRLVCEDVFEDLDKDDRKMLIKSDLFREHSGLKGKMGSGTEAGQWDMRGKRIDGLCIFTLMD